VQAQKEVIERQKKDEQEQAVLALAKQREVNDLKSTFVAMTSHEFRNPLAAILSSQELLRDFGERLSASDSHELFVIIDSSVQRMTAMLDKILIIGRADAHLLEFRPTLLNLPDLCQRLMDETLRSSQATSAAPPTVELRLELLGDDMAHIDENLLRHSLGNLLSNAVKYSPAGGRAVLHVRRLPQSLAFEVVDQGIGIPAEDLPHLFNAFRRASNVGNIQGTGLGLAIVKQSVELHGGTIEVGSEFGKGSRFTIYLPQP
jgi:signal transduction histidine kinase